MSPVPTLEYPLGPHDSRCLLWRGFLDAAECAALLCAAEQRGFVSAEANYPPSYRNNLRQVFDDTPLAQRLLSRLQGVLPTDDEDWLLDAINPRWRSCRYAPGQAFHIHQDGVYHAPDGRISRLTFMLYLNDASEFSGGDTVFYDGPPDLQSAPPEVARVRPSAGALIVFDHTLWHAGADVSAGLKTILRSDLLYRRRAVADVPDPAPASASGGDGAHRGYVFCLLALEGQQFLSGGRDGTIRRKVVGQGSVVVLAQHAQSVLGLHAVSPTRYAAVTRDACLAIHALDGSAPRIQRRAHAGALLCVSGQGERLYTGGADHQIGVWDQQSQPLARLHGHRGWVWDLAVLDQRRLLSVSEDQRVLLWDQGVVVDELDLGRPLRAVVASPCRAQLMVADAARCLHLVALTGAGLLLIRQVQAHSAQIRKLRSCADGTVLSCAEDGQIKRWDWQLRGGKTVAQREGFATDALQLGAVLVSAGYAGGVLEH